MIVDLKGLDFDSHLDNPVRKLKLGKMITEVNICQIMEHNSLKRNVMQMRLDSINGVGTQMSKLVLSMMESNLM